MAELRTVADVRRMLRGQTNEGESSPSTPTLPAGAVSATIETVEEHPLETIETVETEVVDDGSRTVIGSAETRPKARR